MVYLLANPRSFQRNFPAAAQRYLKEFVRVNLLRRGQLPFDPAGVLLRHFRFAPHVPSLDPFRRGMTTLNSRLGEARRKRARHDADETKSKPCRIALRNPVEVPVASELLKLPACTITLEGDRLVVFGKSEDGRTERMRLSEHREYTYYGQPYQGLLLEVMADGRTLVAPSDDARTVARLLQLVQDGSMPATRLPTFAGHCVFCGRDLSQPGSKAQGAGDHCLRQYGQPLQTTLEGLGMEAEVEGIAAAAMVVGPQDILQGAVRDGSLEEGLSTDDLREMMEGFGVRDFNRACADLGTLRSHSGRSMPEGPDRLQDLCIMAEHLGGSLLLTPYIAVLLAVKLTASARGVS